MQRLQQSKGKYHTHLQYNIQEAGVAQVFDALNAPLWRRSRDTYDRPIQAALHLRVTSMFKNWVLRSRRNKRSRGLRCCEMYCNALVFLKIQGEKLCLLSLSFSQSGFRRKKRGGPALLFAFFLCGPVTEQRKFVAPRSWAHQALLAHFLTEFQFSTWHDVRTLGSHLLLFMGSTPRIPADFLENIILCKCRRLFATVFFIYYIFFAGVLCAGKAFINILCKDYP